MLQAQCSEVVAGRCCPPAPTQGHVPPSQLTCVTGYSHAIPCSLCVLHASCWLHHRRRDPGTAGDHCVYPVLLSPSRHPEEPETLSSGISQNPAEHSGGQQVPSSSKSLRTEAWYPSLSSSTMSPCTWNGLPWVSSPAQPHRRKSPTTQQLNLWGKTGPSQKQVGLCLGLGCTGVAGRGANPYGAMPAGPAPQ